MEEENNLRKELKTETKKVEKIKIECKELR